MESGGGRIVNMISFCTTCPLPTLAVYTSTKAALLRLSEGMRAELLKFGVDVVLFNPGDHPGSTPLCAHQVSDARVYFKLSVFFWVSSDSDLFEARRWILWADKHRSPLRIPGPEVATVVRKKNVTKLTTATCL